MGKLEDDVSHIKSVVDTLANEINQIKFQVLRIHSEISKFEGGVIGGSGEGSPEGGAMITAAVDLGPVEERLDELTKQLVTREEIDRLEARIEELSSERIREAQETISRVTALFQSGLEMVKLESTLADVKSLLEETVLQG
ncbi:MAG: hypothetical protein ACXAE3_10370 [Candidatus Kariarchaeaceae archaeon]|jgi:archaellum component FlaC